MALEHYDIIIIGAGPAGLSAAINAKIRNREILVLEQNHPASAADKAVRVDNYLGLGQSNGRDLRQRFLGHVEEMGIEIARGRLSGIHYDEGEGCQLLLDDAFVAANSLIIATGAPYQATIPEEDDYVGRGLGYCATCDGPLYRNRPVLIVAYGEEAEEEANFMAEICSQVYYLPMVRPVGPLDERIKLLEKSKPEKILADKQGVSGLRLQNGQEIATEGIFILGAEAAPDRWLTELELEGHYIKVDRTMATNLAGVFAAGDCTGQPFQIAKAVGEGQIAGLSAARFIGQQSRRSR